MYDVFVSFKHHDLQGNLTKDYAIANELYHELKKRGVEVFLSDPELRKNGEADYREAIETACVEAQLLILVATDVNFVQSPQVKYEWSTLFHEEILNGNKPGAKMVTYLSGISVSDLPPSLKNRIESFDYDVTSVGEVCDFVEKFLGNRPDYENGDDFISDTYYEDAFVSDKDRFIHRFSYRIPSTRLIGRDSEIRYLEDFCADAQPRISWTVVHGEGGSGKSRLVNEFCDLMRLQGWAVVYPVHAKSNKDDLIRKVSMLKRNALFCFDYVKYELDDVEDIIQTVTKHPDLRRFKIKFILIERDVSDVMNRLYVPGSGIADYHYRKGNLCIPDLSDNEIRELIDDYASQFSDNECVPEDDKKKILRALDNIDPKHKRPLFAMFVTDAWIEGDLDNQKWDNESTGKYIAEKETARIYEAINSQSNLRLDKYRNALYFLIAYTTFINTVSFDDLIRIASDVFNISSDDAEQMIVSYRKPENNMLRGIEPDLVGEYVCLDILNGMEKRYLFIFFEMLFQSYFYDMIAYLQKIDTDYPNAFSNAGWRTMVSNIEIPQSISYLKNGMFAECKFIETVHLHDQITEIGKFTFRNCEKLTAINLPNSLGIIGEAAFQNCVSLRDVVPDDGKGWMPSVISIGPRAFKNCKSISELLIPRSVKSLGERAFEKCISLKNVEIPHDITCIKSHTFEDCVSLKTIIFKAPKGVAINSEAFRGCKALKKVINSKRITEIGVAAFYHCESLISISFSSMLRELDRKAFAKCFSLRKVDLLSTALTSIAVEAFSGCCSLESVQLPDGLKNICASAFRDCESLTDLRLPLSCSCIKEQAFLGCRQLSLSSFGETLPKIRDFCAFGIRKMSEEIVSFVTSYYSTGELTLPKDIIRIGDRAFKENTQLESLNISGRITKIGREAFLGCIRLRIIRGSFDSVTKIGAAAFCYCKSLTDIPAFRTIDAIPEKAFFKCEKLDNVCVWSEVKQIGRSAFAGCTELQWVDLVKKSTMVSSLAFAGCDNFNLSKNFHVKPIGGEYYIGGFIFNRFENAEMDFVNSYNEGEDICIPSSCVGFFENPFAGLRNIRSIIVPDSVRQFIDHNFSDIPNLREIVLPEKIGYCIKEGFFANCQALSVFRIGKCETNTIPENMKIAANAFDGCRSLSRIHLPESLRIINAAAFRGCASLKEIILPRSLEQIEAAAFCSCSSLETIIIPPAVKMIETAAFKECVSLQVVFGLEFSSVQVMGKEIFRGCVSLREIAFPEGLKSVLPYAFYDCKSLPEVDLTRTNVCYIGISAFQNCYMLKRIVVPVEVKEIQKFTFKNCTQIEEVILPPGITSIGLSAFFNCNMLTGINTEDKFLLTAIGEYAFSGCHRLERFVIPENVKQLSKGIFRRCSSLKKIELHSDLTSIPVDCFYGCKQLESITADAGISHVGAGAFRNCYNLKDFSIFKDLKTAEPAAFRACSGIEEVAFTKIRRISSAMFMECHSLKHVSFPELEKVGSYAFCDCEQLESVPIQNITDEIGLGAFWNCSKLSNVSFSESIKIIHPSAFRGCNEIKSVVFPMSITTIYAAVFRGAEKLSSIIIPESVEIIKKSAFRDCSSLNTVKINSRIIDIEATVFKDCSNLYYFNFVDRLICSSTAFDGTPQKDRLKKDQRVIWKLSNPETSANE